MIIQIIDYSNNGGVWMNTIPTTTQQEFEKFLIIQRVAPKTKEAYLRAIREITAYHGQAAEKLSNDQIQDFLLYNIQDKQLSWSSCNVLLCGLKKFYRIVSKRNEAEFTIPPRPRARRLPMLLSREEVSRILTA